MASQRELFLRHQAQTSDFPLGLEIVRAEGSYMYDHDGHKILDLIAGIGVSSVGHRHPHVQQAIHNQLEKYTHLMVYGEFIQHPQVQLAKALSDTLPDGLDTCYFVNSGSEAVEGALKLAKRFTGRSHIVSCVNAYHGSSHGALSVGGNESLKRNFRPLLPDITLFRFGIEEDIALITTDTSAVIIETVQGEAGVRTATPHYFAALRKKCTETGTLLIADEIQCGFGRTGTMWTFEQYGFVPDILVCAKGMGGGMPIGAFIASHHIMGCLKDNPILGHITTFGGHPVNCAASLATLEVIQQEQLISTVASKAALFKQHLVHPKIREVRQQGLMMAVEFDDFNTLKPIIDRCIERGVLTDWFLFCDNAMRIAPPLTITSQEIEEACATILDCI